MPKQTVSYPPPSPLVVALAYDGLCMFEFGLAVEVFGLSRPEMGNDWYRFAVASADAGELHTTAGLRLSVDGGLELLEQAGTIIVPGWRSADAPVPNELRDALRAAHQRGARLMSICSGVFVLAATGLLHGKKVTTHWRYTEKLAERHPELTIVPNVLYVDEGQILTSAGSAAGIDLCLHLIRRDKGAEAANSVARRLVVAPHRDGGQAQFHAASVPHPSESSRLSPVFDILRTELGQAHTVSSLAKRAGMSERTFLRRFQAATGVTPARWLLQERLRSARALLEGSLDPVETIAETCGFGSATNLRHHFRRELQTTPTAYRASFSVLEAV
ncbi:transcriptional regulator FtrA [Roseibium sp. CAU 1637]|uniref:Transcriptional regulator FtrA n=1 Tax=Roseibium limicola TaxID=2816037 RepID=A0A939ELH7_9HYPH|nr:transcriptional regulator FtrA [Roseibium limicola]MBO0344905.1 transcriptional regulator FtrA [Roseibium limicola]